MSIEYQISQCKKCQAVLSEPTNEPRTSCPVCGETTRVHTETLTDGLMLYDHMRMKGKHSGVGKPFFEARTGADYYRKEHEWRHLERIVDRGNDLYVEIIKDLDTGEIISEVREPLADHQGHGAAKHGDQKPYRDSE